jgi:hypothetical protein
MAKPEDLSACLGVHPKTTESLGARVLGRWGDHGNQLIKNGFRLQAGLCALPDCATSRILARAVDFS